MRIRSLVKGMCMPKPLAETDWLHKKYLRLRIEKPGMPFISHVEGDLLYMLSKGDDVKACMEVGLGTASSATYLLEGTQYNLASVVSIDFRQSDFDNFGITEIAASKHSLRHKLIQENSNSALPNLMQSGAKFDLIFLDGWKVFDHLLLDTYYSSRMLKDRGFLFFDDARMPSTQKVISLIKKYYKFKEIEYSKYETKMHRAWFFASQGFRAIRRPYRVFQKPYDFDKLDSITKFDYWNRF